MVPLDVELIARFMRSLDEADKQRAKKAMYEYPLMEWHDVRGSQIKPHHYFEEGCESPLLDQWQGHDPKCLYQRHIQ